MISSKEVVNVVVWDVSRSCYRERHPASGNVIAKGGVVARKFKYGRAARGVRREISRNNNLFFRAVSPILQIVVLGAA
jgi:hypothetical protein